MYFRDHSSKPFFRLCLKIVTKDVFCSTDTKMRNGGGWPNTGGGLRVLGHFLKKN